jgi:methylmalonyl-CoA mutase cobalamin-binding subunit
LTVCLVVLGRHIPRLSFLSVVLSNEEALTPAEDLYYRLLTVGEQDGLELVEAYLKANSLTALYDSFFIPVITALETDHHLELLDDGQHTLVVESLRDIIEDMEAHPPVSPGRKTDQVAVGYLPAATCRVYCLPVRADRDELAAAILAQVLQQEGFEARIAPTTLGGEGLMGLVAKAGPDVVCISVVAPSRAIHARYLCLKLRALLPLQKILVGLWGATGNVADAARRVRDSGAAEVVTTFADAVRHVAALSRPQMAFEPIEATKAS